MTNILEPLQAWRNVDHADNLTLSRNDIIEIIVEIERLRSRNASLETAHKQMQKSLDNAYAEIERLRVKAEEHCPGCDGDHR